MNISGSNYYLGAYIEKYGKNNVNVKDLWKKYGVGSSIGKGNAKPLQDYEQVLQTFKIDSSEDRFESSKDLPYLESDGIDNLYYSIFSRKDLAEKYGESDVFKINGNQQWVIFSEKLYKSGFFDQMSDEEILEMDDMLRRVTSSMDSLNYYTSGSDYMHFAGKGMPVSKLLFGDSVGVDPETYYYMDKEMWETELVSSTEALRTFCKSFVPEEHQAEFQGLIDQYFDFNSKKLEDYQSPYEETGMHYMSGTLDNGEKHAPEDDSTDALIYAPALPGADSGNSDYLETVKNYFSQLSNSSGEDRKYLLEHMPMKESQEKEGISGEKAADRIKGYWERLFELQERYNG